MRIAKAEQSYPNDSFQDIDVPKESILGPKLFTLYLAPLCEILDMLKTVYHFYADDGQILFELDAF